MTLWVKERQGVVALLLLLLQLERSEPPLDGALLWSLWTDREVEHLVMSWFSTPPTLRSGTRYG